VYLRAPSLTRWGERFGDAALGEWRDSRTARVTRGSRRFDFETARLIRDGALDLVAFHLHPPLPFSAR
jgi:hypothetical protein